eukprot:TRINITY_DN466_c0_g3_i1.p1 TRINITY_DN466_c0_g3~~TRINITY_DN466_c0_g3_i1.p1  ORF type:complete len:729 (+),score=191.97 TRINITY_DN466_c0_g3_i1:165-2351(+)
MMMTDSHAEPHWNAPLNGAAGGYLFANGVLSLNEPCDVGQRRAVESSPPKQDDPKTLGSLKFPSSSLALSYSSSTHNPALEDSGAAASPACLASSASSAGTAARTPLDPKGASSAPARVQRPSTARTQRRSFDATAKKPLGSKPEQADPAKRRRQDGGARGAGEDDTQPLTSRRSSSITQPASTWQRYASDTTSTRPSADTPPSLFCPPSNGGTAPIPLLKQLKGSERSSQASSTHSGGKVAASSASSAGSRRSKGEAAERKGKANGTATARAAAAQQGAQWKRMTKGLSTTKQSHEDREKDREAQQHDTSKLLSMSAPTPREPRRRGSSIYSRQSVGSAAARAVATPRKASTRSQSGGAPSSRTHRPPATAPAAASASHPSLEKILAMGPEGGEVAADRVIVAVPETLRGPTSAERYMSVRGAQRLDASTELAPAAERDGKEVRGGDGGGPGRTSPPPKLGRAVPFQEPKAEHKEAPAGAPSTGDAAAAAPRKAASVSLTSLSKGESKARPAAPAAAGAAAASPAGADSAAAASPESKACRSLSPTASASDAGGPPCHPALAGMAGKGVSLLLPPKRGLHGDGRHRPSLSMDSGNGEFSISSMGADTPRDPINPDHTIVMKCIDCGFALPTELPFCAATGKPHPLHPVAGGVGAERCVIPASHEDTEPTAIDRGSIADTDVSQRQNSYSLALKCTKAQAHYSGKSTRALLQCTGLSDIDDSETVGGD